MKGTLKNTTAGWYVWYSVMRDEIISGYDSLPLHQETFDPTTKQPIIPLEEGKQVEFEMVNYDGNTKMSEGWIGYAKLIIPKEEPKDVVLGYKTSLDAQMLDSKLPKQENCCTPEGQIKRYVDCIGCDRKPKPERMYSEEEVIEFTMNMISQYVVGNTNIWDRDRLRETLLLKKL